MRQVDALEFHTTGPSGEPYRPMQLWAISAPDAKPTDMSAWTITTSAAVDPNEKRLALHDLKHWLLFGSKNKPSRFLIETASKKESIAREVLPAKAAELYLRSLVSHLPDERQDAEISVLMPAFSDSEAHSRYRKIIRTALPNANILVEPEMVLEYFRLVSRTLQLDKDRNNVVLVIDVGASTTNVTAVFSNRRDEISRAKLGNQRTGRLRVIPGQSADAGGRWVDETIAKRLGIVRAGMEGHDLLEMLSRVEDAKLAICKDPRSKNSLKRLDPELIEEVAFELVERFEPLLIELGRRIWQQQTETSSARDLSAKTRAERNITGPEDGLKFVDFVLLAGGTSQLLGFRSAVETVLPSPLPSILEVGHAFAIAPAVGALAHCLHEKGQLEFVPQTGEATTIEVAAHLEGGISRDVSLHWNVAAPAQPTNIVRILEAGDPIAYSGGERANVAQLDVKDLSQIRARFMTSEHRVGNPPQSGLIVTKDSPSVGFRIDSDRKIHLVSDDIRNVSTVWLDLKAPIATASPPSTESFELAAAGGIRIGAANVVAVDFGMSKSVVVSSRPGLLRVEALESLLENARALSSPPSVTNNQAVAPQITLIPVSVADKHAPIIHDLQVRRVVVSPNDHQTSFTPANLPPAESAHTPPQNQIRPSISAEDFVDGLLEFKTEALKAGFDVPMGELVTTLLALALRRAIMLAGPPGCGKSMLSRIVAHLLGYEQEGTYHEVPVQSHWTDDTYLFGSEGILRPVLHLSGTATTEHLILFDEMNLTRPEYYLNRFFHALDEPRTNKGGLSLLPCRAIGTLNIDDTSRSPSPKILDRCYLIEIDPVPAEYTGGTSTLQVLASLPRLQGRYFSITNDIRDEDTESFVTAIFGLIASSVKEFGLRDDLLPSRRVHADLRRLMTLFAILGENRATRLTLTKDEVVDRFIASRVLIKLSGPVEHVLPTVTAISSYMKDIPDANRRFPRITKRLATAESQKILGFVSPWQ